MADDLPAISSKVKELREAARMSQQALANAAGVSISVISHLEQGVKADPRQSTLHKLANALGVDVCDLARLKPKEAKARGRPRKEK